MVWYSQIQISKNTLRMVALAIIQEIVEKYHGSYTIDWQRHRLDINVSEEYINDATEEITQRVGVMVC